jgi:hypothetical protein
VVEAPCSIGVSETTCKICEHGSLSSELDMQISISVFVHVSPISYFLFPISYFQCHMADGDFLGI